MVLSVLKPRSVRSNLWGRSVQSGLRHLSGLHLWLPLSRWVLSVLSVLQPSKPDQARRWGRWGRWGRSSP